MYFHGPILHISWSIGSVTADIQKLVSNSPTPNNIQLQYVCRYKVQWNYSSMGTEILQCNQFYDKNYNLYYILLIPRTWSNICFCLRASPSLRLLWQAAVQPCTHRFITLCSVLHIFFINTNQATLASAIHDPLGSMSHACKTNSVWTRSGNSHKERRVVPTCSTPPLWRICAECGFNNGVITL